MQFFLSYFCGMKKRYIIAGLLLIYQSIFSQKKSTEYEFIGALSTSDKMVITYKINFDELQNGKIQGVSVTDFYGENYTKSKISGTIDHKKKIISFKEIKNISTISNEDESSFCFVNASNVKFKNIKGKTILNGRFIGVYQNGNKCASGNIYMVSSNILDEIRLITDTMTSDNDTLKKFKNILNEASKPVNSSQII